MNKELEALKIKIQAWSGFELVGETEDELIDEISEQNDQLQNEISDQAYRFENKVKELFRD